MAPGATSLGERPSDAAAAATALDSAQLSQQDESNRLAEQRQLAAGAALAPAKSNLATADDDDGRPVASDCETDDEERKHFLESAKSISQQRGASLARQESHFAAEDADGQDSKSKSEESARSKSPKSSSKQPEKSNGKFDVASKQKPNSTKEQQKLASKSHEDEAARRKRKQAEAEAGTCCCCWPCKMLGVVHGRCQKRCLVALLLLLIYSLAVYCLPFVRVQPSTVAPLPVIPFNFHEGPLKASSASAFKSKHLFRDQLHGPESLAFDSQANLYMAVEGGFILYAHLNKSSPLKRAYLDSALQATRGGASFNPRAPPPELIKIAELNGLKPVARRSQRDGRNEQAAVPAATWRRDCQLDEQIYGQELCTTTPASEQERENSQDEPKSNYYFKSKVRVSRCSKPLGIRLSPDESSLYVIDTLNGLYRVNLRQAEKTPSNPPGQRQVIKLIDFKANQGQQTLAAVQLEPANEGVQVTRFMNVSMRALDDLTIDYGAGSQGGDLIYMTVASQVWPAVSFVYDHLEGRPSGLVLRYDTSTNQLVVLEPNRLAHVRSSNLALEAQNQSRLSLHVDEQLDQRQAYFMQPSASLGTPRLDENDLFDDRPLNFPNGLELMDDRQALLIADTSNKRIIKHWIRGPRRGTSDLWAWTPQYPDNIRRGFDRRTETYWVVGCGRAPKTPPPSTEQNGSQEASSVTQAQLFKKYHKINAANWDLFSLLHDWPRVRKFALKNIYLMGAMVEFMGAHVFRSVSIQDYGYELKTGSNLCSQGCSGMMVLQYNKHGDIIRSIHSREFPNDLTYYSQVNELIDGQAAEHVLYLGSPSYNYVTKLILPTETRPLQPQMS